MRVKDTKHIVSTAEAVNVDTAKKYFAARKNMDIETFNRLFEVVEKKMKKDELYKLYKSKIASDACFISFSFPVIFTSSPL